MRRFLIIPLLILPLAIPEALADVVVIVHREAEAAGNYVRICDIARVEGPREQVAEVARTILGPTPPKGKVVEITRWDIENRLYEMGIALQIVFTGNDSVKVLGSGMHGDDLYGDEASLRQFAPIDDAASPSLRLDGDLNSLPPKPTGPAPKPARRDTTGKPDSVLEAMPEDARGRVELAVSHYLAGRYRRPDIEIESTLLSLSEAIPYSAHEVAVEEAMGGQVPGKATLKLRVKDRPDSQPRQVTVSANAEIFALAPVAAKQLYKGDVLEARDVVIKRIRMQSGRGYLPPNPKSVAGRELQRNLAPGEPVTTSEAIPTQAVKRGDQVVSDTRSNGWQVQGAGKALGGGMVGDVIAVEDSKTKYKYQARITGRGVVSVIPKKKNN